MSAAPAPCSARPVCREQAAAPTRGRLCRRRCRSACCARRWVGGFVADRAPTRHVRQTHRDLRRLIQQGLAPAGETSSRDLPGCAAANTDDIRTATIPAPPTVAALRCRLVRLSSIAGRATSASWSTLSPRLSPEERRRHRGRDAVSATSRGATRRQRRSHWQPAGSWLPDGMYDISRPSLSCAWRNVASPSSSSCAKMRPTPSW